MTGNDEPMVEEVDEVKGKEVNLIPSTNASSCNQANPFAAMVDGGTVDMGSYESNSLVAVSEGCRVRIRMTLSMKDHRKQIVAKNLGKLGVIRKIRRTVDGATDYFEV